MRSAPNEPPRYGHDHFFPVFNRFRAMSGGRPSPACRLFLESSDKAREQWRLEERLSAFKSRWGSTVLPP